MNEINYKYPFSLDDSSVLSDIELVKQSISVSLEDASVLKLLFSLLDLTSLNTEDSTVTIRDFVDKVNAQKELFPGVPNVAALCVYPVFASVLKAGLKDASIGRAVVAGGFPSSQTFTDVKVLETRRAITFGATEVDVVISVGEFLDGNYEFVSHELAAIKSVMGDLHLKVILETGALKTAQDIWTASMLAMESGADFIKTSTGKQQPAASYEAAYVMLKAIKTYHNQTGRRVGFKPAGGISTVADALVYYGLVKHILGDQWLTSEWFRIGASRLANGLLSALTLVETGVNREVKYY